VPFSPIPSYEFGKTKGNLQKTLCLVDHFFLKVNSTQRLILETIRPHALGRRFQPGIRILFYFPETDRGGGCPLPIGTVRSLLPPFTLHGKQKGPF